MLDIDDMVLPGMQVMTDAILQCNIISQQFITQFYYFSYTQVNRLWHLEIHSSFIPQNATYLNMKR